ncbi:AfsR/SARP family transcriptional regulator [Kitasatospora azatica]|uniref:AfsR/SARP family transcriptional regulator n=1 Tax=Kitasatospora azatica TaxID=58347 RepID=UPI0005658AD7|nr:BTAD domain-containing putative transcriptional regulator [Kitasatospora azatica]
MRFAVLGPVTVSRGGVPIPIRAPMARSLLAALLLNANRSVPIHQLLIALWGDRPPATATASLHNHVMRLRRTLGAADGVDPVQRTPDGYLIAVRPGQLDLQDFAEQCRLGQEAVAAGRWSEAAGRWSEAAEVLSAALALWRGEPLSDVPGVGIDPARLEGLREARLQAVERLADVRLRLGQYHRVIAELRPVVREHPWVEVLHGQLMRALYGAGRQADALEVYRELRRELANELGIEPSAAIRALHQRILDSALEVVGPPPAEVSAGVAAQVAAQVGAQIGAQVRTPAGPPRLVPRQLPLVTRYFTGRIAELKSLAQSMEESDETGAGARITTITGTAGIGKTTLALHWAHQAAERFPDGQLYVNLRGFDPSSRPMTAEQAVRGFLDALGTAPERMPRTLETQTALYRSLVAGRRLLVVLDNARDAEQVRPLLPGSATCPVLVTSRNRLAGLVAVEGAHPLSLDLLSHPEAADLLARRLGPETMARESAAVAELIESCARLPLALGVAAARLAMNPTFPVADLLTRLADLHDRLTTLNGGDSATDVRAVFSWSYEQLSSPAARLFRLLSVHPGPDLSLTVAARISDLTTGQARAALDELTDAHLLTEHQPGRFLSHDLLRAYAGELARELDGDRQRRAATERMLDHCLHTAYAAERLISPARDPIELAPACPGGSAEQLLTAAQAMDWCDAEYRVLLAAGPAAAEAGFDTHAWQIPWATMTYLLRRGRRHDVRAGQFAALAAARRLDDRRGQALAHRHLGQVCRSLGDHELARTHLLQALELEGELNSPSGQATVLHSLAIWYEQAGGHQQALDHAQRALELYRAAGHRPGQARLLNAVGWYHSLLGNHQQALTDCRAALTLLRESGDRYSEACTLGSLGHAHWQTGDAEQAVASYRQALELHRELGSRPQQALVLTELGDVQQGSGEHGAARQSWQAALAILTELGHPDAEQVRARLAR